MVGVAYWPVLEVRSLVSDDVEYLVQNPLVRNPSWSSAARFLREVSAPSTVQGHYQPLTMISLMLDCAAGGSPDNLMPFRRTNLLLHLANTGWVVLLMFLLFRRPIPAALAGLAFGLHPTTVESVAWLSDRKTVLAAFFAMASLNASVVFARSGRRAWWGAALAAYVLAVLSKANTVPLPVVFLLLDFWPLRRLSRRALVEKLPFFAIAAASAAITLWSHHTVSPARLPWEEARMPLWLMIPRNLLFYPVQFLLPLHVTGFHDFPPTPFLDDTLTAAGLVAVLLVPIGLAVSLWWTRAVATGWLVYAALIFPMLGLVGFMDVIAADRHLYLSMLGFLLILAAGLTRIWDGAGPTGGRWERRAGVTLALAAVLLAEGRVMRRYLDVWQDSARVHRHMAAHAPASAECQYNLGIVLAERRSYGEAVDCYRRAIALRPAYWPAHVNLGILYRQLGDPDRAIHHLREALALAPGNATIHNSLANALVACGRREEALAEFAAALQASPDYVTARMGQANLLADLKRTDEAVAAFRECIRLSPTDYRPRLNLAGCLAEAGRAAEALAEYDAVLARQPGIAQAHFYKGLVLERLGRHAEAAESFRQALALQPDAAPIRARLEEAQRRAGAGLPSTRPGG